MKSLMPAVVRQYGDRGDYAPVPVVSWTAAAGAHILCA